MTSDLPTPSGQSRAVTTTDPDRQLVVSEEAPSPGQNVAAGLVPFAVVTFLVVAFVVAAWTLIAAAGAGG
jgi:uncharacterized membrane protein